MRKPARTAAAKIAQNRTDPRWRENLPEIVSGAFEAVSERRFSAKKLGKEITLPYATAGRLFGALYWALARSLATELGAGRRTFVLRATDEELEQQAISLIKRSVDRKALQDYASLLKKAFGSTAAIDHPNAFTGAVTDRRYRVRFHYRTADTVRCFWIDLWERCGKTETLLFTTDEHGPTRSLTDLVEAGPAQFGPADTYSEPQLEGFLASLAPERLQSLVARLQARLAQARHALFGWFTLSWKSSFAVGAGIALFAGVLGLGVVRSRTAPTPPHSTSLNTRPRSAPETPDTPPASVPRDVSQLIQTWPRTTPPPTTEPGDARVLRLPVQPLYPPDGDCTWVRRFAEEARKAALCGQIRSRMEFGYMVRATVAFPIADTTKRYYFRVTSHSPSNTWRPAVIEAVITGTIAEQVFVMPINSTGPVREPLELEMFSVDRHFEVRFETSDRFTFVY